MELCPRPVLGPRSKKRFGKPLTVVDFDADAADQSNTDERLRGAEARAEDQDVDGSLDTVFGHNAVFAHFGDAVSNQLHVRSC